MIAMGFCGPVAGYFIVKHGARRSIVFGNILGFSGFVLIFFHTRLWELFLGYGLLVGLATGFGGMVASTTVINNWFVKKRGMALSIFCPGGAANDHGAGDHENDRKSRMAHDRPCHSAPGVAVSRNSAGHIYQEQTSGSRAGAGRTR
jgi:hypothetical protein